MDESQKLKIRKRLRDAFRFNRFPRPTHCNYCGIETKIEAHHYRYEPEDYVWVCKQCHSEIHEGFNIDAEGNRIDLYKNRR